MLLASKFRVLVVVAILVGSTTLLLSPLTWESQFGRNSLLSSSQSPNFYSYYAFYTSYTYYENGTSSSFPNIGLAGAINLTYSGHGSYEIRAVLVNTLNKSEVYSHYMNISEGSAIAQWLLPSGQFHPGQFLNLWNGSYGQVSQSSTTFGTKPFSKEGIVKPYTINVQDVQYANKTVLSNPYLDIASAGTDQYMNIATIWSGYLAPFTKIFPMVNYSTELVFGLEKTNVKLGPLDVWDTYVAPMIIFAAAYDVVVVVFYFLTIGVSKNRTRRH